MNEVQKKHRNHHGKGLLPISVIRAASCGNPESLQAVIKHYERLILHYSVIWAYSDDGKSYFFVDEALRSELRSKLINKVVGFEFKPAV